MMDGLRLIARFRRREFDGFDPSGIPVDARGKERERRGRSTGFDGVKTTFRRTRMRVDGRTDARGGSGG